jgi:hypothetical protein
MPKIFNISLHRSATMSFVRFCEANGLRCQHWPGRPFDIAQRGAFERMDLEAVWQDYAAAFLGQAEVFADVPVPFLYRRIHQALPDAKFVLVRRALPGWIKSVRHHGRDGRKLDVLERMQYRFITGKTITTMDELTDQDLLYGHEAFTEGALSYLAGTGADFMFSELADPALGPRLAAFLGFDQVTDFPRVEHSW